MSGFNHYDASKSQAQQYPKSVVSTRPFGYDFFTYTTSTNASFATVGTLTLATTNPGLCPTGRVLHATGRAIYPNVNPMNTFPTANTYTGPPATFQASISGTTMNVSSVYNSSSFIFPGMVVIGAAPGTFVVSGGPAREGNYTVSVSQSLGTVQMVGSAQNGTLLTGPKFLISVYDPITHLKGFIDPTSPAFAPFDQLLDNAFDLGPTANTAVYGSPAPPLGGQAGRVTASDVGLATTGDASRGTITVPITASSGVVECNNTSISIYTTACTVNSRIFLTGTTTNVIVNQENGSAAGVFRIKTNNTTNVHWLVVN